MPRSVARKEGQRSEVNKCAGRVKHRISDTMSSDAFSLRYVRA